MNCGSKGKLFGGTAINPSLRLYSYDHESMLDYSQYHLNLTTANGGQEYPPMRRDEPSSQLVGDHSTLMDQEPHVIEENGLVTRELKSTDFKTRGLKFVIRDKASESTNQPEKLNWEIYYKAREAYNLQRLDAVNMKSLLRRLQIDDKLFSEYYRRNSAGVDNGVCEGSCKKRQLCAIPNLKVKEMFTCMLYNRTYFSDLLSKTFGSHDAEQYSTFFVDTMKVTDVTPNALNFDTTSTSIFKTTLHNLSTDKFHSTTHNYNEEIPENVITYPSTNSDQKNPENSDHTTSSIEVLGQPDDFLQTSDSNSSNPYISISHTPGEESKGLKFSTNAIPVLLMISFAAIIWIVVAVLFFVVRWRRNRRDRIQLEEQALFTGTRSGGYGYVSLPDYDGSDD